MNNDTIIGYRRIITNPEFDPYEVFIRDLLFDERLEIVSRIENHRARAMAYRSLVFRDNAKLSRYLRGTDTPEKKANS